MGRLQIGRMTTVVLLGVLLAGCPGRVRTPPPTVPTPAPAPVQPAPVPERPETKGATLYTVDPEASDVNILVYRGGVMARLGHNHVVTPKSLRGGVSLHPDAAKSTFELSFPVAELVVDDPQARQAAGADFSGDIPPKDRDGTRKNMLREEVLDAEHFPTVQLQSIKMSGPLQSARIATLITIRNVSREVEVPAQIAQAANQLTASGQFDIKQTDFGIKPFSIGLGALEVVDQMTIRFRIVARKQQ
jgi:polyisoprenoid-binding protein YceI